MDPTNSDNELHGIERRRATKRRTAEKIRKLNKRPLDGRCDGRKLAVKRANKITQADLATFHCPHCGHDVADDLIRLRQGFYECRKCNQVFCKDDVYEPFDHETL
jgi:ribosomal protein L37AE/L43A